MLKVIKNDIIILYSGGCRNTYFQCANDEQNKLKVKNDHRSKFPDLSNWKEEAWKKQGLQRDWNPWPLRYRCDALPTEQWSRALRARSICWVHVSRDEWDCVKYIWINFNARCGFIAQLVEHRTGIAKVMDSNPVEVLNFFWLLSNCLNWKIYCDDHPLLSSTTAVHIWIISYTARQDKLNRNKKVTYVGHFYPYFI